MPSRVGRDLTVIDPGTRHWAVFSFIHDKWQVTPKLTIDLGLRHEYYTPLVGLASKGGLANYDPATNSILVAGYGDVPANLGVKKYLQELRAANRHLVSHDRDDRSCAPATASARFRSPTTATRSTSR